jgi:hypothetical protein
MKHVTFRLLKVNMIDFRKRKIKIRKDFYMLSIYKTTCLQFSLQVSVARTVEVSRYFLSLHPNSGTLK